MRRKTERFLCGGALVCVAGLISVLPAPAAAAGALVPHRAIYDMELGDVAQGAGVAALSGRMVYEFSGSACEGYSVSFRFVTKLLNTAGTAQVTDLRTSSFEDPNALAYQFLSKTYVDQKLVDSTRGSVAVDAGSKTVNLKEPEEKTLPIDVETLFPTEHLRKIIETGLSGGTFLAADVFDGSDTGDKVYATTAVIGTAKQETIPMSDAPTAPASTIDGATYWPVSVAYFDKDMSDHGEEMPSYQLAFKLYDNGISRELTLNYGDFTIKGKLRDLEFFEETGCTN